MSFMGKAENPKARGIRPETGKAILSKDVRHPVFWPVPFERENYGRLSKRVVLRMTQQATRS
jgi:hypothetical protein